MRDTAISDGDPQMMLWYAFNDVMDSSDPAGNWNDVKAAAFAPYVRVTGLSSKRCIGRLRATGLRAGERRDPQGARQARRSRGPEDQPRAGEAAPRPRCRGDATSSASRATDRQGKGSEQVLRFRGCLAVK